MKKTCFFGSEKGQQGKNVFFSFFHRFLRYRGGNFCDFVYLHSETPLLAGFYNLCFCGFVRKCPAKRWGCFFNPLCHSPRGAKKRPFFRQFLPEKHVFFAFLGGRLAGFKVTKISTPGQSVWYSPGKYKPLREKKSKISKKSPKRRFLCWPFSEDRNFHLPYFFGHFLHPPDTGLWPL